jgi:uncharacterized protein with ACT and thioredoxin-like domain
MKGENISVIFFYLEEKREQDKLWNRIKTAESHYKYDINSINEKLKFKKVIYIRGMERKMWA